MASPFDLLPEEIVFEVFSLLDEPELTSYALLE
jgi:hypothetical protein